jgi:hypothetical protein
MERQTMPKASEVLIVILLVMFVVSVIGVTFLWNAENNSIEFEVAKALLQLGTVAVVGAVITVLIDNYQRAHQLFDKEQDLKRQDREKEREIQRKALTYREDLLKTTLVKTRAAYAAAKKARRLLRAAVVVKGMPGVSREIVLAKPYDTYLEMINDAQLDLEHLARELRGNVDKDKSAFTDPNTLATCLESMEGYLLELVREYGHQRRQFQGDPPELLLTELSLLGKFIKPSADNCELEEQFIKPLHTIDETIRADLLHPELSEYVKGLAALRTGSVSPKAQP